MYGRVYSSQSITAVIASVIIVVFCNGPVDNYRLQRHISVMLQVNIWFRNIQRKIKAGEGRRIF